MKPLLSLRLLAILARESETRPLWVMFVANEYLEVDDPLRAALIAGLPDTRDQNAALLRKAMSGATLAQLSDEEQEEYHRVSALDRSDRVRRSNRKSALVAQSAPHLSYRCRTPLTSELPVVLSKAEGDNRRMVRRTECMNSRSLDTWRCAPSSSDLRRSLIDIAGRTNRSICKRKYFANLLTTSLSESRNMRAARKIAELSVPVIPIKERIEGSRMGRPKRLTSEKVFGASV